jgi:hypothetical protein
MLRINMASTSREWKNDGTTRLQNGLAMLVRNLFSVLLGFGADKTHQTQASLELESRTDSLNI